MYKELRNKIQKNYCIENKYDNLCHIEPLFPNPLNDAELLQSLHNLSPIPENSLIIVNDTDRSTPSARIIKLLRKNKFLSNRVQFLIATGTHKPISIEESKKITNALPQDEILIHDCYDEHQLVEIGVTSRGTEVSVNSLVCNAKNIFTIGGVEPHYFAGFTGGVKSIVPGVTGYKTVEQNHRWAITPEARILQSERNPLFEDLWEAAELIRSMKEIQSIQLVNHASDILSIHSGSLRNTFDAATIDATRIYSKKFDHPVQRIISFVLEPLDKSLYQAQKAMENIKRVLADGGTFVMIAQCSQGIGTPAFFERMRSLETPVKILNSLSFDTYRFGDHKAYYWAQMANRAELLYLGDLSSELVGQAFMNKITEVKLMDLITQWIAAGDEIMIDFAGGYTAADLA